MLKAVALAHGLTAFAKANDAVIMRNNLADRRKRTIYLFTSNKIENRKANDVAMKANDILYVPDSAGKKALARGGEAALGIGTGVAVYRIVLNRMPRNESVYEDCDLMEDASRLAIRDRKAAEFSGRTSRTLGSSVGADAARSAPARLRSDSPEAPVAHSHLSPHGCHRRDDCLFQDEAGLPGVRPRRSRPGIAEQSPLSGRKSVRRIHGHGELHRDASRDSPERNAGLPDDQVA